MSALHRTLHTVRSATALATNRPAYAAGARAAVATVLPLLLASQFGPDSATWMSLGGFNVALADRGGPYRTRATTMGAVTLGCAIAVLVGSLAGGHTAAAIPVTFAVAIAGSLARVWGMPGASVGGASLSTFVIALAYPASTMIGALERAGFAIGGGALAMAIALIIWPLRPYRPARVAVAHGYRALAGYVDDVTTHLLSEGERSDPSNLPAGSATVRLALESSRAVLTNIRRGLAGSTGRGARLVVLGELVDQIFGHIVAVAETMDTIASPERIAPAEAEVVSALAALAATARATAAAVEAERDPPPIPLGWNGAALRALVAEVPHPDAREPVEHYRQVAVILDRAAQFAGVAVATVGAMNDGGREAPQSALLESAAEEVEESASPLALLRAVLAPGSLLLRYALRVAVVTTVAVALTELFHLKRGYWMTITVVVILQPYTGATTSRALQRVIGTVLGAIITAALGALFHDPRAIFVLAFVFAALCVALLPVNYAAYSVFLTPTFVLLAEASAGDWHLATTRVMNTLLGGALALVGSRVLWPSPEWSRLPGYMADALRANRDYLRLVVELFGDRSERAGEAMRDARRDIGLATVNAEESFQRLLGEFHGAPGALSPVLTFLTYTRRLTASIAALALARHSVPTNADATLAPFMRAAIPVMDDLASAISDSRRPMPLPILVGNSATQSADRMESPVVRARVDRLARQVRMLHDAVDRWMARDDGRPAG